MILKIISRTNLERFRYFTQLFLFRFEVLPDSKKKKKKIPRLKYYHSPPLNTISINVFGY